MGKAMPNRSFQSVSAAKPLFCLQNFKPREKWQIKPPPFLGKHHDLQQVKGVLPTQCLAVTFRRFFPMVSGCKVKLSEIRG